MPYPIFRPGAAPGSLGRHLRAAADRGLNSLQAIQEFRSIGPLTENAQEAFDNAVVRVARERLTIVDDLISAGLTFPLSNWLSVMQLDREKISEEGHARRTMIPNSRDENQLPDRERVTTPIYATVDGFNFHLRLQLASERAGTPIDTTMVEQATRRVMEAVEDAAINGVPANVAGNSAPGLVNATNVNTFNFVDSEAWDAAGHSGEDILADVLSAIDGLEADRFFGPYYLYVPTTYNNKLNEDFKSNSDKTIRERLEQLNQLTILSPADRLQDDSAVEGGSDRSDTVIMFQATSDVARVIMGQQPTPISWEDGSGMDLHNLVMACMVPEVVDTYDDQSGIIVGTPS